MKKPRVFSVVIDGKKYKAKKIRDVKGYRAWEIENVVFDNLDMRVGVIVAERQAVRRE